jgi:uncharacterized glyoxalase superfamily protein PhnB
MAVWYRENLGLRAVLAEEKPPYKHFLAEAGGRVVLELYRNERALLPDYREKDPLELHLAFVSTELEADVAALEAAGALRVDTQTTAAGDRLAMLRDPWGIAIQLCNRARPFEAPA